MLNNEREVSKDRTGGFICCFNVQTNPNSGSFTAHLLHVKVFGTDFKLNDDGICDI